VDMGDDVALPDEDEDDLPEPTADDIAAIS